MATVSVTINVTDVPGEAPEKPDTPMVVAASSTSLAVNWTAPDNPGPPITDYDYRYKEPTASGWTEVTDTAITQTNANRIAAQAGHVLRGAGAGEERRGQRRVV